MVKIEFVVKEKGFPYGTIYKMVVWFKEYMTFNEFLEKHKNKIEKLVNDKSNIHSIEQSYITYTNTVDKNLNKKIEFGKVFIRKKVEVNSSKSKDKSKDKSKSIKNVKKINFPNVPQDDLEWLKKEVESEMFKRKYNLSDNLYNFYIKNKDILTIKEAIEYAKNNDISDIFSIRKKRIKEILEKKLKSSI